MTALLVGLFGIAGALLRFAVDGWLAGFPSPRRHWPWATLLVNVAGSFVIGLSVGVTAVFGPEWHSAPGHRVRRRPDHFQFLDHCHGAVGQ
jgi:CrcB protein